MFADTYDRIGPLGAKAQGECAINPVAPAIANALMNATGVRFAHLPLTPDRIFGPLKRRLMNDAAADAPVTVVVQTRTREGQGEAFAIPRRKKSSTPPRRGRQMAGGDERYGRGAAWVHRAVGCCWRST